MILVKPTAALKRLRAQVPTPWAGCPQGDPIAPRGDPSVRESLRPLGTPCSRHKRVGVWLRNVIPVCNSVLGQRNSVVLAVPSLRMARPPPSRRGGWQHPVPLMEARPAPALALAEVPELPSRTQP